MLLVRTLSAHHAGHGLAPRAHSVPSTRLKRQQYFPTVT